MSDYQSASYESSASSEQPGYGQSPAPVSGPPRDALAGFWIRFLGALIDGLILSLVGALLVQLIGRGVGGLSLVVQAAYYIYFHSSAAGQTVGNYLVGIRVAKVEDGRPLTVGSAVARWAVSLLSGFALLIGYLWMLWDGRNQTWHDKAAGSVVVKTSQSPAPGPFGKPASA